jgi:ferredoxin-NADP reductase
MAEKKAGIVVYRHGLSPLLEIFRLAPDDGGAFPEYKSGQYIALSRDNCKLTKKVVEQDGSVSYAYDVDDSGRIKRGTVTHSYSIASAPAETRQNGYLEFYVVLEMMRVETPGRLSESLFSVDPESDNRVQYVNKISGEFTLERRAAGFENVVMVGAGTGLAPFASMVKQLFYDSLDGKRHPARFTLFHTNRTVKELGYHRELKAIEQSGNFDFAYIPSVSRPIAGDFEDETLGIGRPNNLLRTLFGMPLKEEQDLADATAKGADASHAEKILKRTLTPRLPKRLSPGDVRERIGKRNTVVLTCGNPHVMEDIQYISAQNQIPFEKEEW